MVKILLGRKEALRRHGQIIRIRYLSIGIFLLTTLFLRAFLSLPISNFLFLLLLFMGFSTFIYDFALSRIKNLTAPKIVNAHFVYMLFDLIILTAIIYLIGGILWFGFVFYTLYIYLGFLFFPRPYLIFYVLYSLLLYTILVITQYLEILPAQTLFGAADRNPQNITYVLTTWAAAIIFISLSGFLGDALYRNFVGKLEQLEMTKKGLEEERISLEIRVRARTRQLREEKKSLEDQVRERTKELEGEREELAKRISELEKFYKLAVGREMKMVELKKEIKRIKKES